LAAAVIGALRVNLGIDSAQFQNGLRQAQSGLAKFGSAVKTGLVAAGAAAGAAVGALTVAVKNTIDAADDMSKAAQKIGVPIEELSRLKYAADLSGVSFEGLQTAVGRLSRNMNDAAQGSEEAVAKFQQLGVAATNADGSLKPASQVLAEIADRFAAMPDGAEKTALAMEVLGKSGADLIPLLNGGSAAMQRLMAEADTFGQVFTTEMGAQAEQFNDNLTRLWGTVGNLAARIAKELLPHLTSFTNWLVANGPAIAEWTNTIIGAFVQFGHDLAQAKAEITALVNGIAEAWNVVTTKVAEVKDAFHAFAQEIVGIFQAIPDQMAQIGADIINGLWSGIRAQWDLFKADVGALGSSITGTFKSVLGIQSPSTVMHEVGVNVMQGLANGMSSLAGGVTGIAESIASTVTSAFMALVEGSRTVSEVLSDLLKQLTSMMLNSAFQMLVGSLFGGGGGLFGRAATDPWAGLRGFAEGGSFRVGGSGGIDSQMVAFKASPNERVTVTKPGQGERHGQSVHVTVGVAADGNGNLRPFVESVAQRNVAQGLAAYDRGKQRQQLTSG
jgi:hypothetical protein